MTRCSLLRISVGFIESSPSRLRNRFRQIRPECRLSQQVGNRGLLEKPQVMIANHAPAGMDRTGFFVRTPSPAQKAAVPTADVVNRFNDLENRDSARIAPIGILHPCLSGIAAVLPPPNPSTTFPGSCRGTDHVGDFRRTAIGVRRQIGQGGYRSDRVNSSLGKHGLSPYSHVIILLYPRSQQMIRQKHALTWNIRIDLID